MKLETNQAFVLLGSNISPIENLQNALARLKKMCLLVRILPPGRIMRLEARDLIS